MGRTYTSGLIGLDVKTRRRERTRRNQFRRKSRRWLVPLLIAAGMVGTLILMTIR